MTSEDSVAQRAPWLTQKRWRRAGGLFIGLAAMLAILAVLTDILRSSVIRSAILLGASSEELPEPTISLPLLGAFWMFFFLTILSALYCAMLDIRYIRLQYLVAKKALLHESFTDDAESREHDGDVSSDT